MTQFGPNLKTGMLLFVLVFGLSAAALYGGAQLVDIPNPVTAVEEDEVVIPGAPVEVTIIGKNSLFDRRSFAAGTGVEITVHFENQDAILHNIAFYPNRNSADPFPDARSELGTGPRVDTIVFTAPASPGSYFYKCDVHPDTMTGALNIR